MSHMQRHENCFHETTRPVMPVQVHATVFTVNNQFKYTFFPALEPQENQPPGIMSTCSSSVLKTSKFPGIETQ